MVLFDVQLKVAVEHSPVGDLEPLTDVLRCRVLALPVDQCSCESVLHQLLSLWVEWLGTIIEVVHVTVLGVVVVVVAVVVVVVVVVVSCC